MRNETVFLIPPSLFVAESDRWLTCLTSYLVSNSRTRDLSSITVQSLPSATRRYLTNPDTSPDLDHIVEVSEWCLIIIAWSAGLSLSQLSISARSLDHVAFCLLTGTGLYGESLGEILVRWKIGCEEYMRVRVVN